MKYYYMFFDTRILNNDNLDGKLTFKDEIHIPQLDYYIYGKDNSFIRFIRKWDWRNKAISFIKLVQSDGECDPLLILKEELSKYPYHVFISAFFDESNLFHVNVIYKNNAKDEWGVVDYQKMAEDCTFTEEQINYIPKKIRIFYEACLNSPYKDKLNDFKEYVSDLQEKYLTYY